MPQRFELDVHTDADHMVGPDRVVFVIDGIMCELIHESDQFMRATGATEVRLDIQAEWLTDEGAFDDFHTVAEVVMTELVLKRSGAGGLHAISLAGRDKHSDAVVESDEIGPQDLQGLALAA